MKKIIFFLILTLSFSVYAWKTDEEAEPTPHEEYESPEAEFITQKIAGILVHDIQVKFVVTSERGKDFIRDLHGFTEVSLPRGMYKIVGDGKIPITKYEAEDALQMIVDYHIWTSIDESPDRDKYIKIIYDTKKITKKIREDYENEVSRHVRYYQWFNYYFQRLASKEITPEEVLPIDEFYKKVDSGEIELE